ncbi:Threonine synthase and cysteate synthase ThrC [Methanonatronarchaeum thermophilum]|uniref:Threonine synthase n=1 Tax=Methanonatronarchaeum thermophilum TaxID=1927129 RepID=A0A1Y3GCX8_9EURY|nr:threonine synthase [Methanonatronarchaeum thermophilum]OUJ19249.1 Threonine synthase and cysteate synthase ThrC [Methanonatronarchaeum thermophilum]
MPSLRCIECDSTFSDQEILYVCPSCDGLLEVAYTAGEVEERLDIDEMKSGVLGVWKYRAFLPCDERVSIAEGGTPLYKTDRLADWVGVDELYIKNEGGNPTGSFKDRGMTVGVSKALEMGLSRVGCASTGNTSAALSIYGAKAGIDAIVLLPAGKVAMGKVAQALMHGANVISIKDNFDRALELVRQACNEKDIYLLNSVNPVRLEGQKTIGYEAVEQLGWEVPDRMFLPVGNAGNISAIHKGLREWRQHGIIEELPKMCGIQSEGSKPFVKAIKNNQKKITPEGEPETLATAIRIGNPVNGPKALNAVYDTGGTAESVSDQEIVEAQKKLARLEGIGVEPASASSVAGLKKLVDNGEVEPDEKIVCVTTGHLLKDSEEIIEVCKPPKEVEANLQTVLNHI